MGAAIIALVGEHRTATIPTPVDEDRSVHEQAAEAGQTWQPGPQPSQHLQPEQNPPYGRVDSPPPQPAAPGARPTRHASFAWPKVIHRVFGEPGGATGARVHISHEVAIPTGQQLPAVPRRRTYRAPTQAWDAGAWVGMPGVPD